MGTVRLLFTIIKMAPGRQSGQKEEEEQLAKEERRMIGMVDGKEVGPGAGIKDDEEREIVKTEAEKRHEEQRRKRLENRLKREGVKTHKERVEELNRYLSS